MHYFLTGEIGIGKSTVIKRTLECLDVVPGGFCTYFGPDRGATHHLLYLCPAGEEKRCLPELAVAEFTAGEPPVFYRDKFEVRALDCLAGAEHCPMLVLDECGRLEREAYDFQKRVLALLWEDVPILGTVRQGCGGWLEGIRMHPQVRLVTVTAENRDALPEKLAEQLRPQLNISENEN